MHFTPETIPAEAAAAIAPAFDRYGLYDPLEWVQRCRDGLATLWRLGECWAITEVFDGKPGRMCHIAAMAGDFVQDLMREIEEWAASKGCVEVFFTGRKGWAKRLPDYEQTAIVMKKVLP